MAPRGPVCLQLSSWAGGVLGQLGGNRGLLGTRWVSITGEVAGDPEDAGFSKRAGGERQHRQLSLLPSGVLIHSLLVNMTYNCSTGNKIRLCSAMFKNTQCMNVIYVYKILTCKINIRPLLLLLLTNPLGQINTLHNMNWKTKPVFLYTTLPIQNPMPRYLANLLSDICLILKCAVLTKQSLDPSQTIINTVKSRIVYC